MPGSSPEESERVISLMDVRIKEGEKEIPEDVASRTGYKRGVFRIVDKTSGATRQVLCQKDGCGNQAYVYECNIVSVIDEGGETVPINDLDPEIAAILSSQNERVNFCLAHIIQMAAENLDD